jgi:CheY-like chemotaxis protein
MESLELIATDWPGKPGGAKRYESDYFVLVSTGSDELTRRSAVRLEQLYTAFTRFLPPTVKDGRPTKVMLATDDDEYKALLGPLGEPKLLNPAIYDPQTHRVLCGSNLRELGSELQAARFHHSQQLVTLENYETSVKKLYSASRPLKVNLANAFQIIGVAGRKDLPAVAPVKADRGQVEQIVMNLAVNARDAMPNGGTLVIETADIELDELYATMHVAVKPGAYVVLTVTDTGTGMSPEVQSRLFEPFFTTKEAGKGTGLGLATVHGIVARAGGTVGVYSEVGKGTSFKVYFPRADARDLIGKEPAPAVRRQGGSQTVLVVEDAEGLRELVKRLLERQGYTVLIASNADEALRLFAENASIQVILTDVVMPGASGPELTKELIEQRPGLKVIYMSGYTEDVIVHHGVLKPGVAFLHKPFTAETLGRKIREELDR